MGMASQIAEREDSVLCSDVRDKLFGPMEFSRRDLGALNIMRGRDNGLPDYNTVRKCFKVGVREAASAQRTVVDGCKVVSLIVYLDLRNSSMLAA